MPMVELIRTNDPVLISWLLAALEAEHITPMVLDSHMSILEGSAAAIPRRVMVAPGDEYRAKQVLERADSIGRGDGDPLG